METEMEVLLITAVSISFLHTLSGPDHYLPFIVLSKSRNWTIAKTIFWTIICGCGHVWSSVFLGLGGVAIGWSITKINWFEKVRGGIAGWALVAFGILYGLWGLMKAKQNQSHKHFDIYEKEVYVYEHKHDQVVNPKDRHAVTPWVMFLIFVLGPCEPMIPLLYFPAAKNSMFNMLLLIIVYTIFTLATMVALVISGYFGFSIIKTQKIEKYVHALSGMTIFICGIGMVFMDW